MKRPGKLLVSRKRVSPASFRVIIATLNKPLSLHVAAAAGSKTYILRSILHPTLIAYGSLTDELILEEEIADAPDSDDEAEDSGTPKNYGSIISWSQADQLGSIGVLYVILTLILVNGRVITESKSLL